MQPIEHIRKNIFKASQVEFAEIAGATQGSISRWERGELEPSRAQLMLIRAEATKRGLTWSDQWFFDVPSAPRPEVAA